MNRTLPPEGKSKKVNKCNDDLSRKPDNILGKKQNSAHFEDGMLLSCDDQGKAVHPCAMRA